MIIERGTAGDGDMAGGGAPASFATDGGGGETGGDSVGAAAVLCGDVALPLALGGVGVVGAGAAVAVAVFAGVLMTVDGVIGAWADAAAADGALAADEAGDDGALAAIDFD